MDTADKKLLNKALPKLVEHIKPDTKFKAEIYAAEILDDETLEDIFKHKDSEELIFQLVQKMKTKGHGGLTRFVSALKNAGQENVVKLLDGMGAQHVLSSNASSLPSKTPTAPSRECSQKVSSRTSSSRVPSNLADYNLRQKQTTGTRQKSDTRKLPGNTSVSSRTDYKEKDKIRARLKDCLPPSPYHVQFGDMAVMDRYIQECAAFELGTSDEIPGPYANPPVGKLVLSVEAVSGINPATAANLSRVMGGRPELFLQTRHGGSAVVSQVGDLCYLGVFMYNRSSLGGGRVRMWANPSASLNDVIAATFGWYPTKIETPAAATTSFETCRNFMTLHPNSDVLSHFQGPAPTSCFFAGPCTFVYLDRRLGPRKRGTGLNCIFRVAVSS